MKIRLLVLLLTCFSWAHAENINQIRARLKAQGELAPLPESKGLLIEVTDVLESAELKAAIKQSSSLKIMWKHLKSSLYHVNFVFEVENSDYPYEPPFNEPFPARPTLTVMDEAIRFFEILQATTGFHSPVLQKLSQSELFSALPVLFPKIKDQGIPRAIPKAVIVDNPVETYEALLKLQDRFGELTSFSMYEADVDAVLHALNGPESLEQKAKDKAYALACDDAVHDLHVVKSLRGGAATRLHPEFGSRSPYPKRRTIESIFKGLSVLDMLQRLTYPESASWHEVEFSWYQGNDQKLLALYHFNRYKYQLAGLLADPEIILWPVSIHLTEIDLFRLTAAPWGLIGIITKVQRGDRHFNTSEDFAYHDVNHVRRIWAYLKNKLKALGAVTRAQKMAVYRQQLAFIDKMLTETEPVPGNEAETELRKIVRTLFFETFHETARPPDRDSMLYDLKRTSATRQPFEVQIQTPVSDLEKIRAFDGNLRSGADKLALDLRQPTKIRYFWDRAPGYLANVDNKLRWGFYDSVFDKANALIDSALPSVPYRTPAKLAEAAERLFHMLGEPCPYSRQQLVQMINDRSGQPELWAYFSRQDSGLVQISEVHGFQVLTAGALHNAWRLTSDYSERWLNTDARLADSTLVSNSFQLKQYLEERNVPVHFHRYFRIGKNAMGEAILEEDIRNLPFSYLAPNHQIENMLSAVKGVSIIDRIWQNKINFKSVEQAERWLRTASQSVHQAVLDRNANGVRNNPNLNVHWSLLPAENQLKDLEVVRISFDSRVEYDRKNAEARKGKYFVPAEQVEIISEAILRLRQKIKSGQPLTSCAKEMQAVH